MSGQLPRQILTALQSRQREIEKFMQALVEAESPSGDEEGSRAVVDLLVQAAGDSDLSSSVAQDQSCSQCLVFAQMASAIGSTPRQFVPLDLQAERAGGFVAAEAAPRTVCVFHSRAPPSSI